MRRVVRSLVVLAGLVPASLAAAGPFGGFSRDGSRYLVDQVRVCAPVTAGRGAPRCEKKGADEVARLDFRKGVLQRGAGAQIAVQAAGTRLTVRSADGKSIRAEWDAGDPVAAVSAVYLSEGGKLVAIEYAGRVGGRAAPQVVVLALAGGAGAPSATPGRTPPTATGPGRAPPTATGPGRAPPTATGPGRAPPARTPPGSSAPTPAPAPPAAAPPPVDPAVTAHIAAGDRELARRRWKKAEEAYRAAVASGDVPAARYGLAAALAGQGRAADAVTELAALARSTHPEAPRWLVEARLGARFERLRGDAGFRRAVGIDPDPGRAPSAYERLVGLGGRWEQTGTACQQPTVDLTLDRKTGKFQLVIRNRCQGQDESTRLGGTWQASGASALELRFPNAGGPEERLACQLEGAADRSGEDRLACTLEDMTFTMRVVRR